MKIGLLKRQGLGITSCRSLKKYMKYPVDIIKCWKDKIPTDLDILIRWGTISQCNAKITYNTAEAISLCSNKAETRRILQNYSDTFLQAIFNETNCEEWEYPLVPQTYFNNNQDLEYLENVSGNSDIYPLIFRYNYHSKGNELFFINYFEEILPLINNSRDYYITKFIDKIQEYRFYIVNNRLIFIAEKIPQKSSQIAWNISQGSYFINCMNHKTIINNLNLIKKCIKSSYLINIDYTGIDCIIDKNNNSYILEFNSAASLTDKCRQKKIAFVFDYIIDKTIQENKKLILPEPNYDSNNIQDFVHPCLLNIL